MTPLGKLFRTTVFKLSLAYLVIFAAGAALVLGGLAWSVNLLLDEQIGQTIEAEITGLAEQYEGGGMRSLVSIIERRGAQPGAALYLLTNHAGQALAGNVASLPPDLTANPGLIETPYDRPGETGRASLALARVFLLPGGFRLLVGRDLVDREALRAVITRALVQSLLWLAAIGTLGGILVARRVLRRIDAMSDTATTIMAGDLTRRLPTAGTGDELDRLALKLNAMLDRIGELMRGVTEVSDNIAHDLRTPLTRLRNGAEQALRTGRSEADYRLALEKTIEEADRLMSVFSALLLIARAEAGGSPGQLAAIDVGAVVADVVELYEPAAEEAGVALGAVLAPGLTAPANRELIGQAIANLIDNALKYGVASPDAATAGSIAVTAVRQGGSIVVTVADGGPGIPPADRTRVLDRFVRLEGSRSQPGSGLGFSLVAAVAHRHGGTLTLEENGPGLRAVLAIPAERPGLSGRIAPLRAPAPAPVAELS